MNQVSVERAAEHLGVSRMQVGRLIQQGDLDASRLGRTWMVNRKSLQRYASARPRRGRPLSPGPAWQRLIDADPKSLAQVRQLANECRRRAARRPVRLLPGELDAALQDARLVLGGADAAINLGAAIGQPRERVCYVRESDLEAFLADHLGSVDHENPNVILRVVDDDVWPFDGQRNAPVAVAAVDLVDIGDVRSAAEVIR
jgi:excisionase family DNA binding protein